MENGNEVDKLNQRVMTKSIAFKFALKLSENA